MYYALIIFAALVSIIAGFNSPAIMLVSGLFLGHALTEVLNDPRD